MVNGLRKFFNIRICYLMMLQPDFSLVMLVIKLKMENRKINKMNKWQRFFFHSTNLKTTQGVIFKKLFKASLKNFYLGPEKRLLKSCEPKNEFCID